MVQKHQCSTPPDFTGWFSIAQDINILSINITYSFLLNKSTNILPKKQFKKLHSQITLIEYGLFYFFLLSSSGSRMIYINTVLQHTTFIIAKHFFKKHFNLKLSWIFAIGANPLRSDSYSLLQLFSGKYRNTFCKSIWWPIPCRRDLSHGLFPWDRGLHHSNYKVWGVSFWSCRFQSNCFAVFLLKEHLQRF